MPPQLSGHARLKRALVLRDALAAEIGIVLPVAMKQLANVEDTLGAGSALEEGKYLEALVSLCRRDTDALASLDTRVRTACAKAQLAPRYAQYLALLLFAQWLETGTTDAAAFLVRLNDWLTTHRPRGEDLEPFIATDLQFAAFWMATAAGKTHVLHACLALLEPQPWDRILLVTPSEALTRQHADKLRQLRQWDVFAYPMDGDAAALGRLLPGEVRTALAGLTADSLAQRLLADVFAWQPGDSPVFRLLKAAPGELGLGLRRGDALHYFGVVNVGDANGLKKALEKTGLAVEEDVLSPSLFAGLDQSGSGINLLIGSRRFAEGWDNYRAASLTLLRLGQGEGALIIQMFGRVVRFAGRNGDGKRLEKPAVELKPLQTAYIYGLRSGYLETFLNRLYANGVVETQQIECPTRLNLPMPSPLKSVQTIAPGPREFTVEAKGDAWLAGVNPVTLSLTATVTAAGLERQGLNPVVRVAGRYPSVPSNPAGVESADDWH
ncbi:MAG: hypothetical protein U1F76_00130 [Candidatus Competibacteraceae bacterium]